MAYVGPVAGDSFGGVQQALTAQDQLRQAMSEAGFRNMVAQQQLAAAHQQFGQEMALRSAVAAHSQAMAERQMALQEQEAQLRAAMQQQQAGTARGYLEAYRQQVQHTLSTPSPAQERDVIEQDRLAEDAALRGAFPPGGFDKLSPQRNQMLSAISDTVNDQHENTRRTSEGVAGLMNQQTSLQRQQADLQNQIAKMGTTVPFTQARAQRTALQSQLDAVNQRLQLLAPQVERVRSDKTLSGMVTPTPDGSGWLPAIPLSPRQQALRVANTAPDQAAPQGYQPTTGTLNGQQWFRPNTGTTPMPAAPTGPFTIPSAPRATGPAVSPALPNAMPSPQPQAQPQAQSQAGRYPQAFYDRVNVLSAQPGWDLPRAFQQAQQEQAADLP